MKDCWRSKNILLSALPAGYHLPPFIFTKKHSLCIPVTSGRFFKHTMRKPSLSQSEIIGALSGSDAELRQTALRQLFEHPTLRQLAIAHVRRHGGNRQDGEDVFQEAIIVFDRKIRSGAFRGEGSLEAYFMGIVRWQWFNEQHRYGNAAVAYGAETPEPVPSGDPEMEYLLTERRDQLEKLVTQLTDKCQKLLKMYQLDYSMDEIARLMGFANGGVAKKEAFLCRKRFRVVLEMYPEIWNDIIKKSRS